MAALLQLGAANMEDWEATLQQILRVDAAVLGVDRVAFWSFRLDSALFCELGFDAATKVFDRGAHLLECEHLVYFNELRKAEIVRMDDVRRHSCSRDLAGYLADRGIASMMDVPVRAGSKIVGVLCHEQLRRRAWRASDQQFAVAVTQSLSTALEARARTRAERAERHASFLAQAALVLARCSRLDEVSAHAVHVAVPELGDMAVLWLLRSGGLVPTAVEHASTEGRAKLSAFVDARGSTVGTGILSSALRLQQCLLVLDAEDEAFRRDLGPRGAEMLVQLGLRGLIAAPLVAGGKSLGVMAFGSTERRYEQNDLRLCADFVWRVTAALEHARLVTDLEGAVRARDEFLTLASHELSTPLAALMLAAEALAARGGSVGPSCLKRASEAVVSQAKRLDRLVGRIIDACEAGVDVDPFERVDLADVARSVARDYAAATPRAAASLVVRADEPVPVRGDPGRLRQVVCNLLDNALTFGGGGQVELVVRSLDGAGVLSVRDHGSGVAPQQVSAVFERFQRGTDSSRGGLGLGLYVTRRIVEAHGGDVRVETQEGEGTTFVVELPIQQEPRGG
jgi:signal transduction histidine kinase